MAAPIRPHRSYPNIRKTLDRLTRMSPAGKVTSQLLESILESWLEYYPRWEDVRVAASGINPIGAAGDPDRDDDGSFLFDSTLVELVALIVQMPHAWQVGTNVYPHVHWEKTTDAAGDVEWEYRYRITSIGDIVPSWSSWIAATDRLNEDPGSTQKQTVDIFPVLDMSEADLSCIISVQLRRNVDASDDDYGADARLWEFDVHYLRDSAGSDGEWEKGEVGL